MDITIRRLCSGLLARLLLLTALVGCTADPDSKLLSRLTAPEWADSSRTQVAQRLPEDAPLTEAVQETTPEVTATLPAEDSPTVPPDGDSAAPPETFLWQMSIPQSREPITPQPGDTTATWNPRKASMFPADEDCDDAMLLEKYLTVEGLSWADLSARGCRQLVLVVGFGENEAQITCYRREIQGWVAEDQLTRMNGWTGKKGVAHDRKRNTLTSPAGLWALGEAFGNSPCPQGLQLPWREVTGNSDWVCDEHSVYFNTWQERGDPALSDTWDYSETEHLADYPVSYAYACVIRYNTPPYTIPERGCAIFFHCAKGPTEGCIGLPEADFLRVLLWLESGTA